MRQAVYTASQVPGGTWPTAMKLLGVYETKQRAQSVAKNARRQGAFAIVVYDYSGSIVPELRASLEVAS